MCLKTAQDPGQFVFWRFSVCVNDRSVHLGSEVLGKQHKTLANLFCAFFATFWFQNAPLDPLRGSRVHFETKDVRYVCVCVSVCVCWVGVLFQIVVVRK